MTDDDAQHDGAKQRDDSSPAKSIFDVFFRIPPPLKRIFDQTPLITYPENEPPLRTANIERNNNLLYIFTTDTEARNGRPSFNPGCLKWQTYLKFEGIPFCTVPSTNHASPSGALPFLLPAGRGQDARSARDPIAGGKLKRWTATQKENKEKSREPEDVRYEAYASLVDHRLRRAWLYQLYLNPANHALVHRLYIAPCSSNPFVQLTIAHQLRSSATTEILKSNTTSAASNIVDEDEILGGAREAMEALAELLGDNPWFFGQEKPGIFDAGLFAYTELLLDDGLGWAENRLGVMLRQSGGLVRHSDKIREVHF
ncbi:hypothetical protein LTR62_006685 [Meristemomyces frigidus]|uniref:Mitochondrial outer membrane protein n=1 Tax=Meristemomyces frigidus TaxID=1508187 RepID=A0AAN7TMM7_9PEZI|nr:hypothetical protein LTR62_006685 [Meristemomyces frigidus]